MTDWTLALRGNYYQTLNTFIVINSQPVQIVHDKALDQLTGQFFVNIATVRSTDASKFNAWAGDVSVDVEIVGIYPSEIGDEVDQIANQVFNRILPTRTTTNLAPMTGFDLSNIRWESTDDLPVIQAASGQYIKRRIIRFGQTIVDNN